MKDKDLQMILKGAYEEPDPAKKDSFIRKVNGMQSARSMSPTQVLAVEMHYIRKRVWIFSILAIAIMVTAVSRLGEDMILHISDMMPLLAGLGMIEVMRARMHDMSELEAVTLISAKGALFARMTVIGLGHLLAVAVTAAALAGYGRYGALGTGLKLIIPYLITTISCMEVERTGFGRENAWSCMAVAVLVIVIREVIYSTGIVVLPGIALPALIAVALLCIHAAEFKKTIRLEEYAWN
ncbi:MAG: hypothetical protein IJS12_00845 [Lachnospiraceae bacterium]|nr:hypothetical protein [Lachnospiraceae bacterium]